MEELIFTRKRDGDEDIEMERSGSIMQDALESFPCGEMGWVFVDQYDNEYIIYHDAERARYVIGTLNPDADLDAFEAWVLAQQPVATPTTWVVAPNERGMVIGIDPTRDELYKQLAERDAEIARLRAFVEAFATYQPARGQYAAALEQWQEAARKALEGGTQ